MTQSARPTQATQQTVSVIICCYTMERLNDIHEAMNSVLDQTLKPYEVILAVDHNQELFESLQSSAIGQQSPLLLADSSQQTQGTQSTPQTKVVYNTGVQGLSETRNAGIRAASGHIVAFIDDDAVAEPDWLENLVRPFQLTQSTQGSVAAVGGRAVPLWLSGSRPSWFAEELDWIVGCTYKGLPIETLNLEPRTLNLELATIRNVPGCNMAFKKKVLEQTGLWETTIGSIGQSFKGGEEAELCLRIKHEIPDALILYEPHAVIRHKVPTSRASLKWIFKNCLDQGICKARVEKLSSKSIRQSPRTQQTLSTENSYLRYILFTSLPARLRYFHKKGSLSQLGAIIISVIATGTGYLLGRVKRGGA